MIGLGALMGLGLSQRVIGWVPIALRRLLSEAGDGRLLAEDGSPLLLE